MASSRRSSTQRPGSRTGVRRSAREPSPSWPEALAPQHQPERSVRRPHTLPAERLTASDRQLPASRYGVVRSAVRPSPTCPRRLSPQHQPDPSVRTPQREAPEPSRVRQLPAIRPGSSRGAVPPSPAWPRSLRPQHQAESSVPSPQVEPSVLPSCRHSAGPAVTGRGSRTSSVPPVPVCPWSLAPQHQPEPSAWMPHPVRPGLTVRQRTPPCSKSSCGMRRSRRLSSAIWPRSLAPQHHARRSGRMPQVTVPSSDWNSSSQVKETRFGVSRSW